MLLLPLVLPLPPSSFHSLLFLVYILLTQLPFYSSFNPLSNGGNKKPEKSVDILDPRIVWYLTFKAKRREGDLGKNRDGDEGFRIKGVLQIPSEDERSLLFSCNHHALSPKVPISSNQVSNQKPVFGLPSAMGNFCFAGRLWIHTDQPWKLAQEAVVPVKSSENQVAADDSGTVKLKRKKLKGKREVVRWLKSFRYKKKKEYERMTAEEKILYKLRKAQKKEARFMESLKKIEPHDSSKTTHDPEILTPEEHFYYLKMGHKSKNYVPIGRRGIFQGVILNMHLHWKKHQTLKVVVKTFTPEEVREIAAELARLSGGIVLEIHEENTIIMYRGKNYSQPPTEIMSPKITLSKRKALDKSKFRDGLRAVRAFIPRLEQDLELLKAQAMRRKENKTNAAMEKDQAGGGVDDYPEPSAQQEEYSLDGVGEVTGRYDQLSEDDSSMESSALSDSEALSDIFETDSEEGAEKRADRPLYLDEFEKFPSREEEPEDFEEHLRQISIESKKGGLLSVRDVKLSDLDEVDKLFLRAGSLLKKKRK